MTATVQCEIVLGSGPWADADADADQDQDQDQDQDGSAVRSEISRIKAQHARSDSTRRGS